MSFANYGQLKTFLASFSKRPESAMATRIPDFVQLAHGMIAQQCRPLELTRTKTFSDSDRVSGGKYTLPSDFLGARELYASDGPMRPLSMRELRMYPATAPTFGYAVYGFVIEFVGSPAAGSTLDMIYFARDAALSGDSDTNLVLTNHPNLYIHGSLYWLHLDVQDMDMAQYHLEAFNGTRDDVNGLADRQRGSGSGAPAVSLGVFTGSSM